MKDILWKNILSNLAAVLVFVQTVYPTFSADTLMASIADGSFYGKALNLALIYLLYNHGKDGVKIKYVTEE